MRTQINKALLIVGIGLLAGCDSSGNYRDPLPYVFVNEQVFINEIRALPLATRDGSFIYINGGLKGIILYRKAAGQFTALERQSPGPGGCPATVDLSQQFMKDSCTSSQFDFNGFLVSGTAGANLRAYSVSFDGVKISITN